MSAPLAFLDRVPTVVDLPLEVLHLILLELPASDVERFGQTCKAARLLVRGGDGRGDPHLWNLIFHRDWDHQRHDGPAATVSDSGLSDWPESSSMPLSALRIIQQRIVAAKRLSSTPSTEIDCDYNNVLRTVLAVAENRAERGRNPLDSGRNVNWLESLPDGHLQGTLEAWVFPRPRINEHASELLAYATYPDLFERLHRSHTGASPTATRTGSETVSEVTGDAVSSTLSTRQGPSPSSDPDSSEAGPSNLTRVGSPVAREKAIPTTLLEAFANGALRNRTIPDRQLAAHIHCLHGPRKRKGRKTRWAHQLRCEVAEARRRVYDSGWLGWENGFGPFHFYRHRGDATSGTTSAVQGDEESQTSSDSGMDTESDEVNPDPVPIFLETSDDELEMEMERAELADDRQSNLASRLTEGNLDLEDHDDDPDSVTQALRGGVPILDIRPSEEVEEGPDAEGEEQDDDDDSSDFDFELEGFNNPFALMNLLRDSSLRRHPGSYLRDKALAHRRNLLEQDGTPQQPASSQMLRVPKQVDWEMVEAIMVLMQSNLDIAKSERWGNDLLLPKVTNDDGAVLFDPMEERNFLDVPAGWSVSRGEAGVAATASAAEMLGDASERKPYDWAHVEGFWGGTYAFLDFPVYITSNVRFARYKAALAKFAREFPHDGVFDVDRKPNAQCLIRPCSAGGECALCDLRPALIDSTEAIGDVLQLRFELLPLSQQPYWRRLNPDKVVETTQEAHITDEDEADEEIDPTYPPLYFEGQARIQVPALPGAVHQIRGSVRPVFSPTLSDPSSTRKIEAIHWSFTYILASEDRWLSEAVQPGPPGTRAPMFAIWSDANHERNSPSGPSIYWRMDERDWSTVEQDMREQLAQEAANKTRKRTRATAGN